MIFKREENIKSLLFGNKFKFSINSPFVLNFNTFASNERTHQIEFGHIFMLQDRNFWFDYLSVRSSTFSDYVFMRGNGIALEIIKKV